MFIKAGRYALPLGLFQVHFYLIRMMHEKQKRCINIDWLEVYCLEPLETFPMNAEYFRSNGYVVKEREYGTRVYNEMFEILNDNGDPVLEVRRNPCSGDSDFSGLLPQSCHLRMPNWMLYQQNPVRFLMDFILKHNYVFKRIFRIDICYDFVYFDTGDDPAAFVRRYLKGQYRKINQCQLTAHGTDNWNQCDWNSLSWGARTSMVSTKLYNKTLELTEGKSTKPYIRTAWMVDGLIDNPLTITKNNPDGTMKPVNVWRLEFSMKSSCDGWIDIEMSKGKKIEKQRIPHRLPLFDGKDRLWERFQDLCYHYFRFKHLEYVELTDKYNGGVLEAVHSDGRKVLRRKDRCRDKKLFYFDAGHHFTQLAAAPSDRKANTKEDILERRLRDFKARHPSDNVARACDIILDTIDLDKLQSYSPEKRLREARALQTVLKWKMQGDKRNVVELLSIVNEMMDIEDFY